MALLVLANLIVYVTGMFLGSAAATPLIVPIIAPPVVAAGLDPVHLGTLAIITYVEDLALRLPRMIR